MSKMSNENLIKVEGGAAINASLLNAIARAGEFLYDLGRSLGTAIRMIRGKKNVKRREKLFFLIALNNK